ncbi:REP-associated tyrosine transposase [Legionella sp. CNM-4043-24]|uniref:REP-associated tyrosine transposase n=1 Tax=Legionella sp. CNM-4043-24 TaxID=3421646 RepID=UPI00403ADD5C
MVNYRRDYTSGATYFFTLALQNRQSTCLTTHIHLLGDAFRHVRRREGFITHAIVVLPEHMHVIWELPSDDSDYSLRWRLIKTRFTQGVIRQQFPIGKNKKGACDLWQKRFWEHRIRDEDDMRVHTDYIHNNPVKHGYVNTPEDWPYSSIHRYIRQGVLPEHWGVR